MPIVGEATRASLRKVIEGASQLGLIADPGAVLAALELRERGALLEALRRCDLPTGVWAAIQRAWAAEIQHEPRAPRVRLGDYQLVSELGRGGMGAVYRARGRDGQEVALKVCPNLRPGDRGLRRFQRECEQLTRMDHPHVVRCLGSGAGPPAWLALELVEGQDLERLLRGGPLEPEEAARIVGEVAEAVAYAHGLGVTHRDLKPSNVLVRQDGRAMLTDFGLVRVLDASRFTETGCLVGTPLYMAPEQARGAREDGTGVDVWGLGAILYHALTGQPPLVADSPLELLVQLQDPRISSPDALNARVPAWLARLSLRCLEKEPADRPSAAEVAQILRAGAPVDSHPGRAPLLALGVALLLALGLLAGWGLAPDSAPGDGPQLASSAPSAPAPSPEASDLLPPWSEPAGASGLDPRDLSGACWSAGVVDPLAPAAREELFAGAVREVAGGRLRVDYQVTPDLLLLEPEREDVRLAEGKLGLVEALPTGGVSWQLGPAGGAMLGRSLWRAPRAAVQVRAVESWRLVLGDPDESGMVFPPVYAPDAHGAKPRGLALTFHRGVDAFDALGRWSAEGLDFGELSWLELSPGGLAPRARWSGRGLGEEIDAALAAPAPSGTLGVYGAVEELREAWIEGVPLRPDRLAGAEVGRWGQGGELAAAFVRGPSPARRGGPFLARGPLRCELSEAGFRLVLRPRRRRELILAEQRLSAPTTGWLRLRYESGLVHAELWREGERLAALSVVHLPASEGEPARVGSVAEVVEFRALRWSPSSEPPHAAYREWIAAAREVHLGCALGAREAAGLPVGAAPSAAQLSAWRARLEACAASALPREVQTDTLVRAAQVAVIAGDSAACQRLGARLALTPAEAAAHLERTGLPVRLRSLLMGWGRYALPQGAAGHALARELLDPQSLDWQRNLAGEAALLTQRYRQERDPKLLEAALARSQAAWREGLQRPAQEGELLNLAGRYSEALERLERLKPTLGHWWPFYQRALARLQLGDEAGACEDVIASFARSRHRMAKALLLKLIPRLPLRGALGQLALFHAKAAATPPQIPPALLATTPRERALLAYLRLARGAVPERTQLAAGEPHNVLAAARAGEREALARLPEVMRRELLVDAFVRLDPELRTKAPLIWR